jgi:uncharacterized protein (TIGR02145 family)
MAQNLDAGLMINGFVNSQNNGQIEKYCYNNLESNCDIYGGLYQWMEMMQYVTDTAAQGICPPNWHVPTDNDWKVLEGTVDSYYPVGDPIWNSTEWRGTDVGGNLKEQGTTHWISLNNGATNSSGFSALGAGYNTFGTFDDIGEFEIFWASNQSSESLAYGRTLTHYSTNVARYIDLTKGYGLSVRCL